MFIFLITMLGAAVGSFLTVAVERFERGEAFGTNRSYCESCKKQLRWWELVPLFSYSALRGKCARCGAKIPLFSFLFEVITAAVFGALAFTHPNGYTNPFFYGQLIVAASLLLLFFYDWRHQVFPGIYLLVCAVMVLLWVLAQAVLSGSVAGAGSIFWTYGLGAAVGIASIGVLAFPSRGTWMGYGDVLLAGILGLWVGYPFIWVTLLLAFYLGAFYGLGVLAFHRANKNHRIAFGPFLILGAFITQAWGQSLFHAIMKLWGG
jgi:prepilin signal peptidase PulO-like enzyme (type II secretory pathway)